LIEDAGEAHRLMVEFLKQQTQPEPPDPVADLAAKLLAESKPMDPQMAAALTTEARWGLYEGSPTPRPEPVAPTDEELPMPAAIRDMPEQQQRWYALGWRAALARYGTPTTQPMPVSKRPWEREGWCDAEGQCWMGDPGGAGFIPSWRLCRPGDAPSMTCSLPHHALPTPEATDA
jgi:hypothetical protein